MTALIDKDHSYRHRRIVVRGSTAARRSVAPLLACVALLAALPAAAQAPMTAPLYDPEFAQSASTILASQPREVVDRLLEERMILLQEVREEGPLNGAILNAYVIFENPIDRVYLLLAQSARQIEFRPEVTSIETIETLPDGQIDEQRLKILFRRYVYRLEYRLTPAKRSIEWDLDKRFDNDLARVSGYWELYAMADGRTLGRSGTSVDVGSAVPAFLQDWITRKNIPQTMKRVRSWVDSDGRYRP